MCEEEYIGLWGWGEEARKRVRENFLPSVLQEKAALRIG
jgi:hypothetical protein